MWTSDKYGCYSLNMSYDTQTARCCLYDIDARYGLLSLPLQPVEMMVSNSWTLFFLIHPNPHFFYFAFKLIPAFVSVRRILNHFLSHAKSLRSTPGCGFR